MYVQPVQIRTGLLTELWSFVIFFRVWHPSIGKIPYITVKEKVRTAQ
jgi:hypothetical protein